MNKRREKHLRKCGIGSNASLVVQDHRVRAANPTFYRRTSASQWPSVSIPLLKRICPASLVLCRVAVYRDVLRKVRKGASKTIERRSEW